MTVRGGANRIPRSLGAVFEAIRRKAGDQSQARFYRQLVETPSDFAIPKSRAKNSENPNASSARMSLWEMGREHPAFGFQHRYGTISDTETGVIHITSLFYKHLRDADEALNEASRRTEIEAAVRLADKLERFALNARRIVSEYDSSSLHQAAIGPREQTPTADLDVINSLLDGFREAKTEHEGN